MILEVALGEGSVWSAQQVARLQGLHRTEVSEVCDGLLGPAEQRE